MKTIVVLFIFLTSASTFAQSKKKENERLKYNYHDYKREHDSLALVFKLKEIEYLGAHSMLIMPVMEVGIKSDLIVMKANNIQNNISILTKLGEDPYKIANITEFHYPDFTDFSSLMNASDDAYTAKYKYEKVVDTLRLEGLKLAVQNEILAKQNMIYVRTYGKNAVSIQEMNANILELKRLTSKIDSIAKNYEALSNRLSEIQAPLKQKVLELRTNYEKKGPKGFSPAYAEVFADVFTPKKPEPTNWENQQDGDPPIEDDPKVVAAEFPSDFIYEVVEEEAEFPGGPAAMAAFIQKNMKYPESVFENGISGRIYLRFVIYYDGHIGNVSAIRGFEDCQECSDNYIKVIESMPNWKPGKIDGKPVNMWYHLPIKF